MTEIADIIARIPPKRKIDGISAVLHPRPPADTAILEDILHRLEKPA